MKKKLEPKKQYTASAKKIKKLRKARRETQKQFAEHCGVSQATVTSWERGQSGPSPASCVLLGDLALSRKDSAWFWKRSKGLSLSMASARGKILDERSGQGVAGEYFYVPRVRKTTKGFEEIGSLFPLAAEIVVNPSSTIGLIVDEETRTRMFAPGDIIVLDTSESRAKDLRSFWEQAVLLDIDPMAPNVQGSVNFGPTLRLPEGLSMGRLLCKRLKVDTDDLPTGVTPYPAWVATLGPLDDHKRAWEPGDNALPVGHWNPASTSALLRADFMKEPRAFLTEAENLATSKLSLQPNCRLLGRVICCYLAQRKS